MSMFRKPLWEVTWPIRPSGTNSVLVRADDPTDAVRAAAELGLPLGDDLSMAFDYEPEVWRLLRPWRWRSYHAAGPEYGDAAPGEVGFSPEPLDLAVIAAEVDSFSSNEGPSEEVTAIRSDLPMEPEYYLGWAALSVNRMAEMGRDGIKATADNLKAHQLYIDTAHKAGVTDEQIREFAQVKLGGRSR